MRKLLALCAALAALTACGGGEAAETQADASSETTAASATRTTPPKATRTTPTPAPSTFTMSPEDEAGFVATVTAQTIAESGDALSAQLVKSNMLVEAQTDFRFDQPARTLVLAVTSTYSTDRYVPELAYDLATSFAPVFWGPEVPDSIRPESLVLFSVTVDDASFLCNGPDDGRAVRPRAERGDVRPAVRRLGLETTERPPSARSSRYGWGP
ncbi:hypothetical protein [Blastococcus colisei]|nr:hypothetical protein [Blastococcus colisei]